MWDLTVCLLCDLPTGGPPLCRPCLEDLPVIDAGCRRCGRPLNAHWCGECLAAPPPFRYARAALRYQYPMDNIIKLLKYKGELRWLPFLAGQLADHLVRQGLPMPGCLVPVPLHWRRFLGRGFNQSAELARQLGRRLEVPVDYGLLRRCRPTPAQAALPAEARAANVRGAFAVRRRPAPVSVALVDDVFTTGATVREIARVLRCAGVKDVAVWTVARAD